jgi:hypothetical protein
MFVIRKLHEILDLKKSCGMARSGDGRPIAYWVIQDPSVSEENCKIIESHLHFDVYFKPNGCFRGENLRVWAVRKTAKSDIWMVAAQLAGSNTRDVMKEVGSADTLKQLFDRLWRYQGSYMHPLHVPELKKTERKAPRGDANAFLVKPEKFCWLTNL